MNIRITNKNEFPVKLYINKLYIIPANGEKEIEIEDKNDLQFTVSFVENSFSYINELQDLCYNVKIKTTYSYINITENVNFIFDSCRDKFQQYTEYSQIAVETIPYFCPKKSYEVQNKEELLTVYRSEKKKTYRMPILLFDGVTEILVGGGAVLILVGFLFDWLTAGLLFCGALLLFVLVELLCVTIDKLLARRKKCFGFKDPTLLDDLPYFLKNISKVVEN